MRFVVYGSGSIGGLVAVRLWESRAQHGAEVVAIARGAHGATIAERGLTLRWPEGESTVALPVVTHPGALEPPIGGDDIVLVAVKSHDTAGVIAALREARAAPAAVVSMQNGVANERGLLRWFEHVYGVPVMAPTEHLEPGLVVAHTHGAAAIFDIGRWPSGTDDRSAAIAATFRDAGFHSEPRADIARWKYAKLLLNLANPIDALCGMHSDAARTLAAKARDEARRVLRVAGIDWVDDAEDAARRGEILQIGDVDGRARSGGSTWQSLARGQPSEVDYLNGEVVLLGRLHGVATPVNALLQREMWTAVAEQRRPGATDATALQARLDSSA